MVMLNMLTVKIEKENGKAMIDGFEKDGEIIKTSIFTAHKDAWSMKMDFVNLPKLVTLKKAPPRSEYPLSRIGKDLKANKFSMENKYVAVLDTIYYIRNSIEIWNELCNDGTFDLWKPEAPYNSLLTKHDPMILLLRLYEIDKSIPQQFIESNFAYSDTLNRNYDVQFKKPVMDNDQFIKIRTNLNVKLNKMNVLTRPIYIIKDTTNN